MAIRIVAWLSGSSMLACSHTAQAMNSKSEQKLLIKWFDYLLE
jgi:hypothetical protein